MEYDDNFWLQLSNKDKLIIYECAMNIFANKSDSTIESSLTDAVDAAILCKFINPKV